MYTIVAKRQLNEAVYLFEIEAPFIARKVQAGQFIILRLDEKGERVPFTVADADPQRGTVTIIVQVVGATTRQLAALEQGQAILDFVGPLGTPTELEGYLKACVIGGGVGCAIAYPSAKALKALGSEVDVITGFRNKDLVILQQEFAQVADHLYTTTDDGSYGEHGFVTQKLQTLLDSGAGYDLVIAIGPVPMMKSVADVTRPYGIKTLVSLNPVMIDGTGMCGGCRVTVGGKIKFACVDGPDFDGHQVDFEELTRRNSYLREQEQQSDHQCRMALAQN